MGNIDKFDDIASSDQTKDILLPGTGIVFRQTPFVTKTADYESGTATAYRTYVFGNFAMIGIWLQVPGDTQLGDGDWKTIDCRVVTDAPPSSYDPTATIGAWCSYRFDDSQIVNHGLLAA